MMTTFLIVHVVVGLWLAVANYFGILRPISLMWNNVIFGIIIALYNIYFLARGNVNIANRSNQR